MAVDHPHPLIQTPVNEEARAWRYMDFAKFVSLLVKREMFFCNLEVLARNDPHEGLLSFPNYRHRQWKSLSDLTEEETKKIFFGDEEWTEENKRIQFESTRNAKEYWARRRYYDRRAYSINCWHMNDHESAAMWTQYAGTGPGVAITSTFSRILRAFSKTSDRIFVGLVRYHDWLNDEVDSTFGFPLSKRMSFSHEQELRLIYWNLETQHSLNGVFEKLSRHTMDHLFRRISGPIDWDIVNVEASRVKFGDGLSIPLDIDMLIDEVYVSPTSGKWFLELIQEICKKFGLSRTPIYSDIHSAPIR